MSYGTAAVDVVQSSTTGTPTQFQDGSGTQIGTLCRAWVNWAYAASTVTIKASFNVSSVTRTGTGTYTVAFANALPDAYYSVSGSTYSSTTNGWMNANSSSAQTASNYYAAFITFTPAAFDPATAMISVFR